MPNPADPPIPKPNPAPRRKAKVVPSKRVHLRPFGDLTIANVSDALTKANGIQAGAARLLQVDRSTVCRFIKAHHEMAEIKVAIEENLNDMAEGVIVKALRSEDVKTAFLAAKYRLDHKGRDRGYGPKPLELGGINGAPIQTENRDMTSLTDAQLAALAALDVGTD